MTSTLIESGKALYTDELQRTLSTRLGERKEDILLATDAAVPTILTALLYRTEFVEGPLAYYHLALQAAGQDLYGWLHEFGGGLTGDTSTGGASRGGAPSGGGPVAGAPAGTLASHALSTAGREYTAAILGEHAELVIEEVARYAFVRNETAAFVVGLSAFAALDATGRHLGMDPLDVAGTTSWLWDQRDAIVQALPSGLDLAPALGLERLPGAREVTASKRSSLIYGIIAIIILIGLLFYVFRSCNGTPAYSH